MPTEFTLPELGENIAAGDVVRVLVSPGDTIAKDQPVLELETDKATIEVPSSVAGTVGEVRVKPGDKVKVGQVVLTVDDGAGAGAAGKKAEAPQGEASKAEARGGREKKSDAKGKAGAVVKEPSAGGEPQTSQEAAKAGADERGKGEVDGPEVQVAEAADTDEDAAEEAAPAPKKRGEVVDFSGARTQPAAEAPTGPAAPAAPSVRRLARELGVEIRLVPGSGPDGRIGVEDVQQYVKAALAGRGGAAAPAPGSPALPDFTKWGEVERKPMSNIRRKTAEHLGNAWRVIPHVTQHDKADITAVEELRKKYAAQAEKAGGKLTMTAIALKIVATAMGRFPQFNASVDMARNEIVYRKSVHVGVAVDTPRGLLVPVLRDVDRKGIVELAADLAKLSEKARG